MSSGYAAEPVALLKALLHAAKYPHASVNGLLLGKRVEGGEGGEPATRIVDAVPLFHAGLTLAPMLEVALAQARCVRLLLMHRARLPLPRRSRQAAPRARSASRR